MILLDFEVYKMKISVELQKQIGQKIIFSRIILGVKQEAYLNAYRKLSSPINAFFNLRVQITFKNLRIRTQNAYRKEERILS